jgi:type IV secretion system protein VirB4
LSDPFDGVRDADSARRFKIANGRVGLARSHLADTGMAVAREDVALEAAFWAQLRGEFALRPLTVATNGIAELLCRVDIARGHS